LQQNFKIVKTKNASWSPGTEKENRQTPRSPILSTTSRTCDPGRKYGQTKRADLQQRVALLIAADGVSEAVLRQRVERLRQLEPIR
jgi:hypothetical protein